MPCFNGFMTKIISQYRSRFLYLCVRNLMIKKEVLAFILVFG